MATTMTEVARAAGVSQKTVSRVVNGEPHVSPDVRDRVLRGIRELRAPAPTCSPRASPRRPA